MSNVQRNFDSQLIERIVRQVVSRLRAGHLADAHNEHAANHSGTSDNSPMASQNQTLTIDEKLITVETLNDLNVLNGKRKNITQIMLKPKAVVTPSARDELRDHGVKIILGDAAPISGQPRLVLATTSRIDDPRLLERLSQMGIEARWEYDTCVKRLVSSVTRQLTQSTRAIIVTEQPYVASCIANRESCVSAAVVRDEHELNAVSQEIDSNLVVIPSDRSRILELVARTLTN